MEKIENELKKDMQEECQVVYILSRIRKILEADRAAQSVGAAMEYQLLWFYCNWVLHYVMDKDSTQKLLTQFFANCFDHEMNAKDYATMLKSKYPGFFKLSILKSELNKFLVEHELSLDLLKKNWGNFCKILLGIIKETPIRFTSGSLQEIELIRDMNGYYCYKFGLKGKRAKPIVKLKLK